MASNLDLGIVAFFLLLSLVIGLRAGRNITSVKDYAVANKSYGTTVLMISLVATMIGSGAIIGHTAEMYSNGLIYCMAYMGAIISIYVLIKYVIPKFDERFYDMISLGDMIKYFYGKDAEVAASFIAYIYSTIIISLQIVAIGSVATSFLGINFQLGAIIAGLVIVIYSSSGGIRAVTMTDILQLAILFATIPMILNIPLFRIGGMQELLSQVPAEKLLIFDHPGNMSYIAIFFFWLMPFIRLQPEFIQRCLMTKNNNKLVNICNLFFWCKVTLTFMLLLIAFVAIIKLPNIHPTEVMPALINEYFPIGLKGFAVAGIIAAIMSTADSCLNTSAILLTHNVLKTKNQLKWMRINTMITGMIAILIGLQRPNIISLYVAAQSFLTCAVCIPLFFGIIRLKVSRASYKASIICGMSAFFIAYIGIDTDKTYIAGFISVIASLLGFISVHLQENTGKIILIKEEDNAIHLPQPKFALQDSLKQLFRKLTEIEPNYVAFGVFNVVNYMFPIFLWTDTVHTNDTITLRFIAAVMSIILLVKPIMPRFLKEHFHWYWNIALTFCLPFLTTVFMLSNRGHMICIANLALAIFLLSTLVDWLRFIIIITIGIFLGINYYTIIEHNSLILAVSDDYFYAIGYTAFYSALIGLVFTRQREVRLSEKLEMMRQVSAAILHEVKTPLMGVKYLWEELKEASIKPKELKDMTCMILSTAPKKVLNIIDGFKGEFNCKENQEEFSMDDFFGEVLNDDNVNNHRKVISCDVDKAIRFTGNKFLLFTAVKNIIRNALQALGLQQDRKVEIDVYKTKRHIVIVIEDNGPGIADDNLARIFEQFFTTKGGLGMGMGLYMCKQIIECMNGEIFAESSPGEWSKFTILLPKI